MPLPTRKKNEDRKEFVDRCMKNPTMQKEYPESEQRYAVCNSQAKKSANAAMVDIEKLTLEATAEVTFEAAGDDGEPKQPTFSMLAYSGGELNIAYARYPVYVDLAGLKAAENITVLLDHVRSQLVGQGVAEITARQVKISGIVTGNWEDPSTPSGEVVLHARNKFKWPCSIGAEVNDVEEVEKKEKVKVNGRSVIGPALIVRAGTLREVSFVTIGGDKKASANIAATAVKERDIMEPTFEEYVKACGKKIEDLTDDENFKLQAAYDSLKAAGILKETHDKLVKASSESAKNIDTKPVTPEPNHEPQKTLNASADNGVSELRAEAKRIAGLNMVLANHPDLLVKALDENWSVDKSELQAELADLRANRPQNVPNVIANGGNAVELNADLCTAALCMKHNIDTGNAGERLVASFGQETVNKAESIRRFRFSDMIRVLSAQSGVQLPMDIGSADWIKAAFSGSDIGATILGAVANKALAAVIAEPNWVAPLISAPASHANFHTHTVYSMAINGDLEIVPQTGEIEHLDMDDESWTRQLKTRGALLAITRQDFINDDLGVFTRNAAALARKAMNAREKALFTVINATATGTSHFTAARGNYITGTAFGHDEIGNMIKVFRNMTGPDGDPILVEPEILLLPPTHEELGRRLLTAGGSLIATGLASTSAGTVEAERNIYGGRFGGQPIVGPYLENSNLTGYSTTASYLLANPAVLPCFEVVYLNGQQSPTIEFFGLDTDPNVLGMTWRVYYDIAAGTAEYRAGVKSAGA